jgi:hypothetical protein
MLLALLFCGGAELVFVIPMAWFEGGAYVLSCISLSFCFFVTFSSYSPKLSCFTCYTSLYLDDYACHYAMMSRNEM